MKRANDKSVKVTVVVPVYNAATFLRECLKSIANQTLREIEVVCVDDGSTDASSTILKEFSKRDKRFVVLHQDNNGAGAARNLALSMARGKYLSILDSDDVFDPDMLETAYEKAESLCADIVVFQHDKLDSQTGMREAVPHMTDPTKYPDKEVFTCRDFLANDLSWFNVIIGWTWDKLFRRSFVEEHALRFQEIRIYNDMFFTYSAVLVAERIAYVPRILMTQRVNHTGRLSGKIQANWPCVITALEALLCFLRKKGRYSEWRMQFSTYALRMLLYTFERVDGIEREKARREIHEHGLKRLNLRIDSVAYFMNLQDWKTARQEFLRSPDVMGLERPTQIKGFNTDAYMKEVLSDGSYQRYVSYRERMKIGKRPKVSVVIPVYNVEGTLSAAIDSALAQTLPKVEVICINDGSTDSSGEILEEYAARHDRILALTLAQNRGLMMAMKTGSLCATGEFVTVLESDDELTPEACSMMYSMALSKQADLVQGRTVVLNPNKLPEYRVESARRILEPYPQPLEGQEIIRKSFIERKFPLNFCGKLYSLELIQDTFLHLPNVHTFMASDTMSFFVAAALARRYVSVDAPVYLYAYGLGITGRTRLTVDDFRKQCSQVDILAPLEAFSKGFPYIEQAYKALQERMYNEAFGRILEFLDDDDDRRQALSILLEKQGAFPFVRYLAQRYLQHKKDCVGILSSAHFPGRIVSPRPIRKIGICYYHMTPGGVQRVLSELIPMFQKMGVKVHLILDKPLTDECMAVDPSVGRSYLRPAPMCGPEGIVLRIEQLVDVIADNEIDMVYYHAYSSSVFVWDALACKLIAKVPFVVHHHTCAGFRLTWNRGSDDFAYHAGEMSLCDHMITLSRTDALYFSAFGIPSTYVPNPVPKSFVDCNAEHKRTGDVYTVLWCARLSPEKQVFDAIRIFGKLHDILPSARLKIVGAGDPHIEGEASRFVQRGGLADCVSFEGATLDMAKYYREADLFLQTSGIEGFSMTILEALSYGVPVVAYEMPYLEIMRENDGVACVRAQDFRSAALKMYALLTDSELRARMVASGRKSIQRFIDFDFEGVWRRLLSDLSASDGQRQEFGCVPISEITLMLQQLSQCQMFGCRLEKFLGGSASGGLSAKLAAAEAKVKEHQAARVKNWNERMAFSNELKRIKASTSYKIGRFLTWPLRKIRRMFPKNHTVIPK